MYKAWFVYRYGRASSRKCIWSCTLALAFSSFTTAWVLLRPEWTSPNNTWERHPADTHIHKHTRERQQKHTHRYEQRGNGQHTQFWTGWHKKMSTRRKWAHRKEGSKSKTGIPHKQTQKDLNQVQESCEKVLKGKCRKTKQHKTRWDISKHAATETQTYRWTYPFNRKLG